MKGDIYQKCTACVFLLWRHKADVRSALVSIPVGGFELVGIDFDCSHGKTDIHL